MQPPWRLADTVALLLTFLPDAPGTRSGTANGVPWVCPYVHLFLFPAPCRRLALSSWTLPFWSAPGIRPRPTAAQSGLVAEREEMASGKEQPTGTL